MLLHSQYENQTFLFLNLLVRCQQLDLQNRLDTPGLLARKLILIEQNQHGQTLLSVLIIYGYVPSISLSMPDPWNNLIAWCFKMRTTIFSIAEMERNVQQCTVSGLEQHPPSWEHVPSQRKAPTGAELSREQIKIPHQLQSII